jgi:D-xylono/L-arabinono-1,4-lactonase
MAINQALECVSPGICHLGEGPLWNPATRQLYWADIYERRIWVYDPLIHQTRLFWQGDLQVGGFAFTRAGGMVLCAGQGVFLLDTDQVVRMQANLTQHAEPHLLFEVPVQPHEMFNDITVDPQGRIFAGTINRQLWAKGTLYRLEKGRSPAAVLTDIQCSNGMTFSMDEKSFFHTDTKRHRITRYAYDRASGEISNPTVYYQGDASQGGPDGMTMDSADHAWVAFWGASVVRRLSPAGKVVTEIPIPAKQPSSVMLAGDDLTDLYITSACEGAADLSTGLDAQGVFLGGPLYRWSGAVRGRKEWLADFE